LQKIRSKDPLTEPKHIAAFEKRQLLEFQRQITAVQGIAFCFPYKFNYPWPEEAIALWENDQITLGRCGNANACVVCTSEKMARHRKMAELVCDDWVNAGGSVYWQRLSLQNSSEHHTSEKYDLLKKTWSGMARLTDFKNARSTAGEPQFCRVIEEVLTIHGWYPHFHVLWLFDSHVTDEQAATYLDKVILLWAKAANKISPSLALAEAQHTEWKKLNVARGTVTNYLFKHGFYDLSFEAAIDDPYTQSLSPFQVLRVYFETGDIKLRCFFYDFERSCSNLRRVKFSVRFPKPSCWPLVD